MRTLLIRASALCAGDTCTGSGAEILRVVHDGVFARNADDSCSRRPWPKGKVEVLVSNPGTRGTRSTRVAYWNRSTTIRVARPYPPASVTTVTHGSGGRV